jgi:hypothetical protein
MATLKEYYSKDFSSYLGMQRLWTGKESNGAEFEIIAKVHFDFVSNSKFVSFYVPKVSNPIRLYAELLSKIGEALNITNEVSVKTKIPGDKEVSETELKFSGRVYIYSESTDDPKEIQKLEETVKADNLFLHYRNQLYLEERNKYEKPLAFISHDSNDKEEYASHL